MSDHYLALNISKTATADEIKKAYRKLAVVWHPDKNPDNQTEATEKFRAIAEAYEVLSDPEQRRLYDCGGVTCNSFESNSRSVPRSNFNHSFSNKRANDIFNAFFADFDDFHQQAFSGFGGFGHSFNADPFNRDRGGANGHRSQGGGVPRGFGGHQSLFNDDFFGGGGGDPFARMGGGMHMNMHNMMLGAGGGFTGFGGGMGMVSSSSSSFSSSTGIHGAGRSVSTSTFIGPDGRRVTRKETTVMHPGGRRETSVEETVDDPPGGAGRGQNRLANGSSHSRAIDLTTPNSSSYHSGNNGRSSGSVHRTSNVGPSSGMNYGGGTGGRR